MTCRLLVIDFSEEIDNTQLYYGDHGLAVIARWKNRIIGFELFAPDRPAAQSPQAIRDEIERTFGMSLLAVHIEEALQPAAALSGELPSVTAAICTKDRPQRLQRLLESLQQLHTPPAWAPALDILVIDNASEADLTRQVCAQFGAVRYIRENKTGLDFARNAALHHSTSELIAFLDDDVVVDAHWLHGLYQVWSDNPDAGGFTGLVLPFALNSEAQILFERRGGFRRGTRKLRFGEKIYHNRLHPAAAGSIGAGCNMAFVRSHLLAIGGFDEALDTGAPLPGGGDLDAFYRVIRSGKAIAYEPGYAVYHEHRETLAQLRKQYWTWGLGFMAFLRKAQQQDRQRNGQHSAMLRWWFRYMLHEAWRSIRGRSVLPLCMVCAEFSGGLIGLCGEYQRSQRRSARIAGQHR